MSDHILKMSEATILGLHAMVMLAQNKDKLISVKEIASHLEVSANHLSKVMQRLNKAGYIDSIKGYNGGFKLSVEPDKVNFLQIYEIFDGKLKNKSCLLTKKKCSGDCVLGDLVSSVTSQVKDKFQKTKLSEFLK